MNKYINESVTLNIFMIRSQKKIIVYRPELNLQITINKNSTLNFKVLIILFCQRHISSFTQEQQRFICIISYNFCFIFH